jgi:PAS domain-containing protein
MSTADLPASLRSTSMPLHPVAEPMPVSDAGLDAQLLGLFFDRVPMGIAVFGTDLRLQRCNKTWTGFYEHYFGVGPEYTAPGRHIFELIPGNEESVLPLFENALAGRILRQAAHRIAIPGIETYWDVVFAPLFRDGEVVGVVDIVTDATDRVLSLQRLEDRITAFTAIAAGMTVDQPMEVTLR